MALGLGLGSVGFRVRATTSSTTLILYLLAGVWPKTRTRPVGLKCGPARHKMRPGHTHRITLEECDVARNFKAAPSTRSSLL